MLFQVNLLEVKSKQRRPGFELGLQILFTKTLGFVFLNCLSVSRNFHTDIRPVSVSLSVSL